MVAISFHYDDRLQPGVSLDHSFRSAVSYCQTFGTSDLFAVMILVSDNWFLVIIVVSILGRQAQFMLRLWT